MEQEVWKPVKGFESSHEVSNMGRIRTMDRVVKYSDGRVFRYKSKILKQGDLKGYKRISIRNKHKRQDYYVHRLVMKTFSKEKELPDVNHIDGDKRNNSYSNLEWATRSGNVSHAVKMGFIKTGEQSSSFKLTNDDVKMIKKMSRSGSSQSFIARKYNIAQSYVSMIVSGQKRVHG